MVHRFSVRHEADPRLNYEQSLEMAMLIPRMTDQANSAEVIRSLDGRRVSTNTKKSPFVTSGEPHAAMDNMRLNFARLVFDVLSLRFFALASLSYC